MNDTRALVASYTKSITDAAMRVRESQAAVEYSTQHASEQLRNGIVQITDANAANVLLRHEGALVALTRNAREFLTENEIRLAVRAGAVAVGE